MALTLEKLLLLLPYDSKPDQLKMVDLSDKGIVGLPKQTAFLKALRRLSLAKNQIIDVAPIANITSLTNLDLSHNTTLTSLIPLKALTNLVVLSVGNCGLRSLEGIEGSKMTLKSLVANDNKIILGIDRTDRSAAGLSPIADANRKALLAVAGVIETIVLSRNPNLTGNYMLVEDGASAGGNISAAAKKAAAAAAASSTDMADGSASERISEDPKNPLHIFGSFEQLRKISLSECGIRCLPRRWYLPLMTELRLANNHIRTIGNGFVAKSLKTIDVSNNELQHWNVLHRCRFLKQLSIKGNPLTAIDTPMPLETTGTEGPNPTNPHGPSSLLHDNPLEVLYLRAVMPQLDILDSRKFANPPAGASPADIQKGISEIHKKEHLARKAKAAAAEGAVKAEGTPGAEDDDGAEDEAVAAAKQRRAAGAKSIRMGMADDEDADAAMDASLMSRRRRRAEEEAEDQKSSNNSSKKAVKEPRPIEPIEDKEYEMPAAIAARAQAKGSSATNLVKRERHYAVGEASGNAPNPTASTSSKTAPNPISRSQKKKEKKLKKKGVDTKVVVSGPEALAALRKFQFGGGEW